MNYSFSYLKLLFLYLFVSVRERLLQEFSLKMHSIMKNVWNFQSHLRGKICKTRHVVGFVVNLLKITKNDSFLNFWFSKSLEPEFFFNVTYLTCTPLFNQNLQISRGVTTKCDVFYKHSQNDENNRNCWKVTKKLLIKDGELRKS